jgi:hypothetical protein
MQAFPNRVIVALQIHRKLLRRNQPVWGSGSIRPFRFRFFFGFFLSRFFTRPVKQVAGGTQNNPPQWGHKQW